jgi:cytoskeletal protein RodZ
MTEQDAGDGVGEIARARRAGVLGRRRRAAAWLASRQIEALEQGASRNCRPALARGMVRAYARLLKLDAEPLVQRIAAQTVTPDNAAAVASVRRPIPITDSARRTNLIYAALSLAILVVIAGVAVEWQRERSGAAKLTFVPAAAQAPRTPAQETPQLASSAVSVTAMTVSPGGMAAPEPVPAQAAPAVPASPTPPAEGMRRLTLKYERDSWVEIRGRDDKVLTSPAQPAAPSRRSRAGRRSPLSATRNMCACPTTTGRSTLRRTSRSRSRASRSTEPGMSAGFPRRYGSARSPSAAARRWLSSR